MKTLVLIFVCCVASLGAENVPVLMWGSVGGSESTFQQLPSLSKLTSDDFSDIVLKKVGEQAHSKPVIAVFVEENLSIEDFSWQDAEGRSSFSQLENLTNTASHVEFFPSVHSPLKGLKRLDYRWRNLSGNLSNEVDIPSGDEGVVFLVKLGDAKIEENRPDLLKRHNSIISDIYESLTAKKKHVIALYTSRHSSRVEPDNEPLVRRVRSVTASEDVSSVIMRTSTVAFYTAESVNYTTNSSDESKKISLVLTQCTMDSRSEYSSMLCRFTNNFLTLEFQFVTTKDGYWRLDHLYVTEVDTKPIKTEFKSSTEIYAPLGFSFHCTPEVKFVNETKVLSFRRFQVQAFMENSDVFGEPFDCVSFFTVPVLTGLLVTALLGLILVIGLAWIMDINTMDRFDDPKGKTITINTSE